MVSLFVYGSGKEEEVMGLGSSRRESNKVERCGGPWKVTWKTFLNGLCSLMVT